MKIKQFAVVALFGMSVGSAQAALLEFNGTYSSDEDMDLYHFNLLSDGAVKIWNDTLTDGLDSQLTVFRKNESTGAYEWKSGIGGYEIANATETLNDQGLNLTGVNEFGVQLKNGFVLGDLDNPGVSDAGGTLNLTAGSYLVVQTGFFDWAIPQYEGRDGTFDEGFIDLWSDLGFEESNSRWSTFEFRTSDDPHAYKLFVEGDVSAVSAVPVPGAVWLFGSALAGLTAVGRKRTEALAA